MLCLITVSLLLDRYAKSMVTHGYTDKWIGKNCFSLFYLFAILLYIAKAKNYNLYILHLTRRFVESLLYRYSAKNRMSILQLLTSFIYYYFMVMNLIDESINCKAFIYANVLQGIVHYSIYKKFYFVYAHYYCEIMIYLVVFVSVRSLFCALNLVWVVVYTYITISNRRQANKSQ